MKLFISINGGIKTESSPFGVHCVRYSIGGNHIDIQHSETRFAPRKQSVVEFLVAESSRGQGIGKQLALHAVKIHKDLGAQCSSIPSLKIFYGLGFRNPANPKFSLQQLTEMLHENSSVFVAKNDQHGTPYCS